MFLPDNRDQTNVQWLSAESVFEAVFDLIGSKQKAEKALNKALSDGKWRARASAGMLGPDHGQIPSALPKSVGPFCYQRFFEGRPIVITSNFWTIGRSLFVDKMWDWERGVFGHVWSGSPHLMQFEGDDRWYIEIPKRWVAFEVEFTVQDVADFTSKLAPHVGKRSRDKPKPRRKKWSYAVVLAALESEIESGAISRFGDPNVYGVQARIENYIRDEISKIDGGEPPIPTVRSKAQPIMEIWRTKLADGDIN